MNVLLIDFKVVAVKAVTDFVTESNKKAPQSIWEACFVAGAGLKKRDIVAENQDMFRSDKVENKTYHYSSGYSYWR